MSSFDIHQPFEEFTSNRFSFTMLKSYILCPLQFYFNYVMQIKPKVSNATTNEISGIVLHDIAANVQNDVKNDKTTDEIIDYVEENVKSNFIQQIMKSRRKTKKEAEEDLSTPEMQKKLMESLHVMKDYVKLESKKKTEQRAKFTEHEFTFTLDDDIIFHGRWDRVDVNDKTGEVNIIDYKSGLSPSMKVYWLQMDIYAIGYYENYNVFPKLTIKSFKNDYSVSKYSDLETIERTKMYLKQIISQIRSSRFLPLPSKKKCTLCKFGDECPFSKKNLDIKENETHKNNRKTKFTNHKNK